MRMFDESVVALERWGSGRKFADANRTNKPTGSWRGVEMDSLTVMVENKILSRCKTSLNNACHLLYELLHRWSSFCQRQPRRSTERHSESVTLWTQYHNKSTGSSISISSFYLVNFTVFILLLFHILNLSYLFHFTHCGKSGLVLLKVAAIFLNISDGIDKVSLF